MSGFYINEYSFDESGKTIVSNEKNGKEDVSKYVKKNGRIMRYRYSEDEILSFIEMGLQSFNIKDISYLTEEIKDAIIRRAVRMFDVPPAIVNSMILSYFEFPNTRRGDEKNITNLSKIVKEKISERVIYLTTYRRIEKDYSDYFNQENRYSPWRKII